MVLWMVLGIVTMERKILNLNKSKKQSYDTVLHSFGS